MAGTARLPNTLKALKERKVIKILTIGASSSAGSDPTARGYQGIIEAMLEKVIPGVDVRIIDRGVSGELARDAAWRMQTEVALTEPDLVLWQVGTNDAMARIPPAEFKTDLRDGIRWLKKRGVDVVLVGQHFTRRMRRDRHYQSIRRAVSRVARREKVLRITRYEAMETLAKLRKGAMPPNEFEATEEGYSCIAEYVVRAITSGLFARKPAAAGAKKSRPGRLR
jgi:lysophospholipase L1-like esterase